MSHTFHSKLQKTALQWIESDELRLCRHASMTHQLAARNALRALELAAAYGTADMISRSTLLRALALCDAAKVRLPILEVNLARGLVAAHQPASELCRKDHICSTSGYDPFSTLQGDVMLTSSGYSSITQSRQLSSEAAFREYGRNFGDESRMSEGTAVPNDQFVAESIPEGLHEDVEDMDGEQQESEDETEMRQQLLKAALMHVVGLMCQPNWLIQHFWSCGSCEKCMAWHGMSPTLPSILSLPQKEHGWSVAALQAGASDLGLSKAASGMAPNGAAGLVEVCCSPTDFSCHSMLSCTAHNWLMV